MVIKARLHSVQGSCGCFYKVSEKVRGKQESLRHIMAPNPKSCWRYFPILCYIYLCFLNKCKNYNWKECSLLNKQTNLWILYLKKKKEKKKLRILKSFGMKVMKAEVICLAPEQVWYCSKNVPHFWAGRTTCRDERALQDPGPFSPWLPHWEFLYGCQWVPVKLAGFMMWTGIQQGLDWVNVVLIKFFWYIKLY